MGHTGDINLTEPEEPKKVNQVAKERIFGSLLPVFPKLQPEQVIVETTNGDAGTLIQINLPQGTVQEAHLVDKMLEVFKHNIPAEPAYGSGGPEGVNVAFFNTPISAFAEMDVAKVRAAFTAAFPKNERPAHHERYTLTAHTWNR